VIEALFLTVTDACNFSCPYCYHRRGDGGMEEEVVERSMRSLFPLLRHDATIAYCGGEPLLAFSVIKKTVEWLGAAAPGCRFQHTLTSNGSLIDQQALRFFDRHRFRLLLSYDGLAQERRQPGSGARLERLFDLLPRFHNIDWRVNATFSPATVSMLFESLREMVLCRIPLITFSLSENLAWDRTATGELKKQLNALTGLLANHYRETGRLPVPEFQPHYRPFLFACNAGRKRLAVDVRGRVWGCDLFSEAYRKNPAEWLESYIFGSAERVWWNNAHAKQVRRNYGMLVQDRFRSKKGPCGECPSLTSCATCPAANLLNGAPVPERVPEASCRLQRISIAARRRFTDLVSR
jgi:radical SAM protein with 4Fe4S-binding SPASM domain